MNPRLTQDINSRCKATHQVEKSREQKVEGGAKVEVTHTHTHTQLFLTEHGDAHYNPTYLGD